MANENLVLYVASYDDAAAAEADFQSLKHAQAAADFEVVGAVVVDIEEYLPPGSSAVIVVADDKYADRIDKALTKSSKKINKAVDSGDYEKLAKELDAADKRVSDAVDS